MKRNTIKKFLDFVEMQTKLATVVPALTAMAYSFYTAGTISGRSMVIYFGAALFLDMSVTAINNHIDMREDKSKKPHYRTFISLAVIFLMLLVFSALGLYLAYLHGVTVFLAGALCLFVGVVYTFGPAPIYKTLYGEIASGFIVGAVIMFIVLSINDPYFDPLGVTFDLTDLRLAMDIDLPALLSFGLVTLPAVFCVANIMLANNICDREKDRQFRYTMVHHLGLKKSLYLFAGLYYSSYAAVLSATALGLLPLWCLLTLLTLPPVKKNIRRFFDEQNKAATFRLAIKNFMLIMVVYALGMTIGGMF